MVSLNWDTGADQIHEAMNIFQKNTVIFQCVKSYKSYVGHPTFG